MLESVTSRPIAADLFETVPEIRLLGARHRESGHYFFPPPKDESVYERAWLPTSGSLWSYTIQRYPPKSPPYHASVPFVPFAVGYIDLPGTLIVEARLVEVDFDQLRVGMPMQLTTFVLRTEGADAIVMFAFRPSIGARS